MNREKWTTENISDLSGMTAIVTGANTGLGKETVKALTEKNALVILAVRNKKKGEQAVLDIQKEVPGSTMKVMKLDLSNLKSVKTFR